MKSGSLRKYLLYAISEILLVVVGILIAIQIDNLNTNNKDRRNERYYLNQMLMELATDIETLENEHEKLQRQIPAIEELLEVLYQENSTMGEFNKSVTQYMETCWYAMRFKSNSATFEEMKSSGKLGLIRNKNLRNKVVILYSNLSDLEESFREVNAFKVDQVIDLSLTKGFGKYLEYQEATFSKYITPEGLYEMRKYKEELINQAVAQNWDVFEVTPVIEEQLEEIKEMISQIKDYQNK